MKLCCILLAVAASGLLVDWEQIFCHTQRASHPLTSNTAYTLNANGAPLDTERFDKYLLASYDTATKEIQSRLDQESLLFSLKFTLVGSILALLVLNKDNPNQLLNTPRTAGFSWAAVVTSAILDTRIHFHQDMIGALGSWIRDHVEPAIDSTNTFQFWEAYLRRPDGLQQSRIYPLLRLNTDLLTLILFLAVVYVSLRYAVYNKAGSHANKDAQIRRLCRIGSMTSFVVFSLVSLHFHPDLNWVIAIDCALLATGLVASWTLWRQPGTQHVPLENQVQ